MSRLTIAPNGWIATRFPTAVCNAIETETCDVRGEAMGMVALVMSVRVRAFAAALAAVAALALGALVTIDGAPFEGPAERAVVSASHTTTHPPTVRPARPGLAEDLTAIAPVLSFALAAGLLAVGVRRRLARRIGDAGDSWRSLLLGAPPVPAGP